MEPDNFCLGCMCERTAKAKCPACGWNYNKTQESGLYLPIGGILHEKYLIGRVLGNGGFGITYIAMDLVLGIKLCIKEFFPRGLATRLQGQSKISLLSGKQRRDFQYSIEKFLDEAQALAKFVSHPGIVTVSDYFEENNTAYLVMLYEEGGTFKDYLKKKSKKLDYHTALKIMMPVMDALREVHNAGLLHRDISPDNIYITKEGQIKLLDFGAARYFMGEHSKDLSIILKPGFAPEEQYRSRGKQGAWTDIYAVGATFYCAITGEVPPESLERRDEDPLVPPSRRSVKIPKNAEAALLKAMSVRAEDRFQQMEDFQQELMEGEGSYPGPMYTGNPPRIPWVKIFAPVCSATILIVMIYFLYPWKGSLTVTTTPENASVMVDGKNQGLSPLIISLTPGEHEILIEKDDIYEITKRTVNIVKRDTTDLVVELPKKDNDFRKALVNFKHAWRTAGDLCIELTKIVESEKNLQIATDWGWSSRIEGYQNQIEDQKNSVSNYFIEYENYFRELKTIEPEIREEAYAKLYDSMAGKGDLNGLEIIRNHFQSFLQNELDFTSENLKKEIMGFCE